MYNPLVTFLTLNMTENHYLYSFRITKEQIVYNTSANRQLALRVLRTNCDSQRKHVPLCKHESDSACNYLNQRVPLCGSSYKVKVKPRACKRF